MYINPIVWRHYKNKTLDSRRLREAEELSIAIEVVAATVSRVVLYSRIYQEVERKMRRYMNHRQKIERWKRTRRWPAI